LSQAFLLYSIQGLVEGNLPLLTMKKGERPGDNEQDVHTPHWHGQTVVSNHTRVDTLSLTAMAMGVADMVADNPGTWLFHCHVNEHFGRHAGTISVLPWSGQRRSPERPCIGSFLAHSGNVIMADTKCRM